MLIILMLAIFIGLTLGIFGGGGAILTVPLLHYGLDQPFTVAVTSSLVIIGIASLISTVEYARQGYLDWKMGFIMAATGMIGAVIGAYFSSYLPEQALLLLLASVMVASGIAMLCNKNSSAECVVGSSNLPVAKTILIGSIIGLFTGMVGAGGGFLVVPALIVLARLPIQIALGTSLFVITLNSTAGVMAHAGQIQLDYMMISVITTCVIAGAYIGSRISTTIANPETMRKGFAIFILATALLLLFKEIPIAITQAWYLSHWIIWSLVALFICGTLLYFLTTTCLARIWRLPLFSLLLILVVQNSNFYHHYYF